VRTDLRRVFDHGTGCALATSIASGLAVGIDLANSSVGKQ
jgi:hydroxymethylpyrimidine/phosphomethylpyrimidine kinase